MYGSNHVKLYVVTIHNQTYDLCKEVVKQNGHNLEHITHQTENMCMEAIKQNIDFIKYTKDNKMKEKCIDNLHKLLS